MVVDAYSGFVNSVFGPVLDFVFGPVLSVGSIPLSIFFLSVIVTSLMIGLNKLLIKKDVVKAIKMKMEQIREDLAQAQKSGDKEKASNLVNELMKENNVYMRQTFKTLIVSLIILSVFFPWMDGKYHTAHVADLPFTLPIIGSELTWLYWYVLVSFMGGWVIRKLVGSEI